MSSDAPHNLKIGEVLEALLEHQALISAILDQHTADSTKKIGKIIEELAHGDFENYYKPVKRKPNWPKFGEKDTIRAFTAAFSLEKTDSGADEKEARAAYVCGLTGAPRTIATMKVTSSPLISFADLSEYLITALESRETEADMTMLDAMTDRPGQSVEDYGRAVLEKATRVLSAHGYNDDQIHARARQIFVRNLRGLVGDKLRDLYPETWEKAISLARNIESKMANATPTLAAAAPIAPAYTPYAPSASSASSSSSKNGSGGKPRDKSKELCGYCKKPGHYKRECRALARKKAQEDKTDQSKNGQQGAN